MSQEAHSDALISFDQLQTVPTEEVDAAQFKPPTVDDFIAALVKETSPQTTPTPVAKDEFLESPLQDPVPAKVEPTKIVENAITSGLAQRDYKSLLYTIDRNQFTSLEQYRALWSVAAHVRARCLVELGRGAEAEAELLRLHPWVSVLLRRKQAKELRRALFATAELPAIERASESAEHFLGLFISPLSTLLTGMFGARATPLALSALMLLVQAPLWRTEKRSAEEAVARLALATGAIETAIEQLAQEDLDPAPQFVRDLYARLRAALVAMLQLRARVMAHLRKRVDVSVALRTVAALRPYDPCCFAALGRFFLNEGDPRSARLCMRRASRLSLGHKLDRPDAEYFAQFLSAYERLGSGRVGRAAAEFSAAFHASITGANAERIVEHFSVRPGCEELAASAFVNMVVCYVLDAKLARVLEAVSAVKAHAPGSFREVREVHDVIAFAEAILR